MVVVTGDLLVSLSLNLSELASDGSAAGQDRRKTTGFRPSEPSPLSAFINGVRWYRSWTVFRSTSQFPCTDRQRGCLKNRCIPNLLLRRVLRLELRYKRGILRLGGARHEPAEGTTTLLRFWKQEIRLGEIEFAFSEWDCLCRAAPHLGVQKPFPSVP